MQSKKREKKAPVMKIPFATADKLVLKSMQN